MLLVPHHPKSQGSSWQICQLEKKKRMHSILQRRLQILTGKKNDIPGTESLLEMMEAEEQQKRDRSDTASTAFSDSHVPKKSSNTFYTRVNKFSELVYKRKCLNQYYFQYLAHCGTRVTREHSHILHDPPSQPALHCPPGGNLGRCS